MEAKKKLNIALLVRLFPCISQTFILNQIVYLLDQGHIVDVYATGRDSEPVHNNILSYGILNRTKYQVVPPVKWERLKAFFSILAKSRNKIRLLKTLNFLKFGKSALTLSSFFKYQPFSDSGPYDVVHAHFGIRGVDAIDIMDAGFLQNTPLITTFHGYDINPLYIDRYKEAYKRLFNESSLITANSNFTIELLKRAQCPEDKLVKLPVSLDTSYFKKGGSFVNDNNTVNIIFCGRLVEFKAPDLVIEIASRVINKYGYKNARFHIVGSGPLQRQLEVKIIEYGLGNNIVFHGSLTQDEIIGLMSAMHIFLYPGINDTKTGRAENQGLVLQEAQSLELPVVTSDVGGIPEGVMNNVTGFVVKEKNVEEFAKKVELLMLDEKLRKQMGKKGREFVIENFDNKVLGRKLEEFYYSLQERQQCSKQQKESRLF